MLQITCGFVSAVVQKLYKAQLHFKKLNYCYYSYLRLSVGVTIMDNNWIARNGCTMMPFGLECCTCSKLLVDLFQESYKNCTRHNWILKKLNYCYYSYLRLSEGVTIMDNNWIASKAVQWCHSDQNVGNAANYLWICFRSCTKIVQGTIEF